MAARFRVLLTDRAWPDCRIEREVLEPVGAEVIEAPAADEQTLLSLAGDADAIGACWAQVTPAVIRAASRCRVISRFGIGLDNICLKTATERGIPVTNVPDYCVTEVADHALALLLACNRKIAFFHHRTKQGEYNRQAGPPLRRLDGQVLGLVGFGPIGRAVFRRAAPFGLRVIASTPSGNDYGTGCPMVPFEEVLRDSDYLSLHLPLSGETERLLGAQEFRVMKPSAYLINTARGGLVDHAALLRALQRNELAGAALDVFDSEPPDLSEPLYRDPRVIATPHAAFLSEESLRDLRLRAARQIAQVLEGLRPEQVVNPQVYQWAHYSPIRQGE